jgi:type I site-specific restriction-modification system R (restriction) subunit
LKDEEYDGLVRTSEKIYDLLTLPLSLPVTIEGDTRSHDLKYIDWKHPEKNVFHVSDEFSIEKRQSTETRRPDILLFVNGIPFAVIECKRPDLNKGGKSAVVQGISQTLRNQRDDEIPHLFIFTQLLLAVSKNEARYGTTGTSEEFWSNWVEEEDNETSVHDQIWKTFLACGKKVHKAESGADLVQSVKNGTFDIITTVINKFESAVGKDFKDDDPNIFVLVDESHRSQYGSFHAKMKQIFPKACYIGFTGTPLLKSEKATVKKFGDFIHKYSMQQAVSDKAVVPLLYEGRMAELSVNRLFDESKPFGYIVDYRGVLGELNAVLNTYNALAAFDSEDVAGTLTDSTEEVKKLPLYHSALWDVFKGVSNKRDDEAFQRFLEPEDRRQEFYVALTNFVRSFKVALSTVYFYQETAESQINRYKQDKNFFESLRTAVRQRYAESVDYREIDPKVRNLMNQHVISPEVELITELINIFDREAFASEVERIDGTAAKADTIAYRVKKTMTTRVAENPATYRRFSDLISETIEAYKAGRLNEIEYLKQVRDVLEQIQQGRIRNVPERLQHYRHAQAYFSVLQDILEATVEKRAEAISIELLADMAIEIEKRIEKRKIRDWTGNDGIQNAMMNDIDDYLDSVEKEHNIVMKGVERDLILGQVLEIAKKRDRV